MMDKHKLNNSGYILIESIIIFIVLAFMILINLQISNKAFTNSMYLKESDILISELTNARQLAINNKTIVNIQFNNRSFYINVNNNLKEYKFKTLSFVKSKELYFNKSGSLNQAYTLLFKDGYKTRKIIFYIGKGWYRLE